MHESSVLHKDPDHFIKILKQETAESHQHLEENKLSKAILAPGVTLSDYQLYLTKLYGVTIACEDQVFPVLAQYIPDLGERYKANLIIDDLLITGLSDVQIDALPVYRFQFSSPAEAFGIMYVLEGSTLGGRILYKHISAALGLTEEHGARYFWGYGSQTGILWKSFISSLTRFADKQENNAEITESAKRTFTLIDNWLGGS